MEAKRYNHPIDRLQSIAIKLKDDELDILELFIQTGVLTATQITSKIKSTKLEIVYKNVHSKVQKLKKIKLLKNIKVKGARNNEKYLGLTDDGIYQLFLKRQYGILLDQLSIRKGQPHISYVDSFLRFYGKNLIFELFVYPYFERQTISVDNFGLLQKIFRYVAACCKNLETAATARQIALLFNPKFSWNKVPGEDDRKVLESLKEIGVLEHIDDAKIEKSYDNNILIVTAPQDFVTIKLNTRAFKAEILTGKNITHEYKITILGSDITVGTTRKLENPIKSTSERSRKIIEPYIFELLSNLEEDEIKVLAHDTKFMLLLDSIHTNESGYERLMELRERS